MKSWPNIYIIGISILSAGVDIPFNLLFFWKETIRKEWGNLIQLKNLELSILISLRSYETTGQQEIQT
jgi:hypothetical protein